MATKQMTAFRIAPELMAAMRTLKRKEGVPMSVQLDFAIRAWLQRRGALPKTKASTNGDSDE